MKTLLIGIGNEFRSDDSVGLKAVDCISPRANLKICKHSGEGTGLMELWERDLDSKIIIVDAMNSGATPGTLLRWTRDSAFRPHDGLRCSSHTFGVGAAITLSQTLGTLPQLITVLGIEGENFKMGTSLSPSIEKALPKLIETIEQEIEDA